MNNKTLIGLVVVLSLVCGVVGAKLSAPLLGGDFAGGIVPSQLLTANTATGGVTPVGNLSLGFGGTAANNLIPTLYTAVVTYPWTPSSTSPITLGPVTAATSTTSTVVAFTAPGFSVGDACEVAYNGAPTSTPFGADAFVTAVSGNAVTTTVTFWNGATSAVTLTVTSTATGVTSTLKTTCFHTGV